LPEYTVEYVRVTTPFHSPILQDAVARIVDKCKMDAPILSALTGNDLGFAVISTADGSNLQNASEPLLPMLARMTCTDRLDWILATKTVAVQKSSIIVAFGPGGKRGCSTFTKEATSGRGVEFVYASPNGQASPTYPKADLLLGGAVTVPLSWEAEFAPRLVKVGKTSRLPTLGEDITWCWKLFFNFFMLLSFLGYRKLLRHRYPAHATIVAPVCQAGKMIFVVVSQFALLVLVYVVDADGLWKALTGV